MYTVFVKDIANSYLYELPYRRASYTEELNKGRNASFVFDYRALDEIAVKYGTNVETILSGAKREIWIEKNTTKIYYGLISDMNIGKSKEGDIGITIASVDFFTILAKRRTGAKRVFTATDAGDIAWMLIDESQTSDNPYSDLGITEGTITTSVNRDRTIRFGQVSQEITQLSNENLKNGFDFDINTSKQFNVFYPTKGTNRTNIFLDDKSILSWSIHKPLMMALTNKVHVLGEGFNDDVVYRTRTAGTTFRETFGTLEDILSERDTKETATLDDKGDQFNDLHKSPTLGFSIVHPDDDPDILTYEVGDSLVVKIDEMNINNALKRVYKRTVSIENDTAIINLTMR